MGEEDWIPRWQLASWSLRRRTQRRKTKQEKKMPTVINITPEDFLKGEAVDKPQWLPIQITDFEERLTKDQSSKNYVFTVRVIDGEYKGKETEVLINEKGPGMAQLGKLIGAAMGIPAGRKNPIKNFTLDSLKGRRLMGMDKPREWDGRMLDSFVDFKPIEGPAAASQPTA